MRPSRPLRRPQNIFYGWWIVAASTGIQLLISALMLASFSSYVAVLRDEFGWSKTLLSFGFAMSRVESGLLGPVQGWLIQRLGPRTMGRVGVTMMAIGFMLFSQITSPVHYFVTFFIISVGVSLAGFMTLSTAIVNWFERYRVRALAVMSLGFAIGGLMVPIIVFSFETVGWRTTAFASGVIMLLVGLPLTQLLRRQPEQYDLTLDGIVEPKPTPEERNAPAPRRRDFTVREALRTPAFWYISLGHASAVLLVGAVMVHLVVYINESLDFSMSLAGVVVAVMTASQIGGMAIGGYLGDRINKRFTIVLCMNIHMIALIVLAIASTLWMVLLFAIMHGIAWGMRGPLMAAIRADYFGRTSFAPIMGFSSMIVMLGMTVGPIFAGIMADSTGGYELGFIILAITAGAGSILFFKAKPPGSPGTSTSLEDKERTDRQSAPRPTSVPTATSERGST